MTDKKLTPKQQMFVKEYLIDLNATQAAIRTGYSEKTAQEQASRLLSNVIIKNEIQKHMDKRSEKTGIDGIRVLAEIECMAFYDPADYINVKSPEDIPSLTEKARRAIIGWSWDKDGNFVLKLSPKTPSLDQYGRHLKLFTDKIEIEVSDTLADMLKKARERSNVKKD